MDANREEPVEIDSGRQGIQSVENAMTVLLALEAGGGPMTLGEVAQGSRSQPSKVHRYLVSLCRVGLASQSSASGRYDLGPALRRLGAEALRRTNDVAIAAEYACRLRDETGHSVNLTVWSDHGPVVVRWDYGKHALALEVRVGATLPLLASSAGRVFLAVLPESMTAPVLALSRQRLSSLSLSESDVEGIRAQVRRAGFALTSGGVIPGVSSIAAPIFTASSALPIVVSVVFPREDMHDSELAEVQGLLQEMTAAVSRELGVA